MKKVIFCLVAACSLVSAASFNEAQIREFEQKCEAGDVLYAVASGYRTIWAITVLRKITKKLRNFLRKLATEITTKPAQISGLCILPAKASL